MKIYGKKKDRNTIIIILLIILIFLLLLFCITQVMFGNLKKNNGNGNNKDLTPTETASPKPSDENFNKDDNESNNSNGSTSGNGSNNGQNQNGSVKPKPSIKPSPSVKPSPTPTPTPTPTPLPIHSEFAKSPSETDNVVITRSGTSVLITGELTPKTPIRLGGGEYYVSLYVRAPRTFTDSQLNNLTLKYLNTNSTYKGKQLIEGYDSEGRAYFTITQEFSIGTRSAKWAIDWGDGNSITYSINADVVLQK